jgi:hypothetical protein
VYRILSKTNGSAFTATYWNRIDSTRLDMVRLVCQSCTPQCIGCFIFCDIKLQIIPIIIIIIIMALQPFVRPWPVSWSSTQSVGLLGLGISPSRSLYLHTEQHKHRININTDIHDFGGIRTHDPSVRAGEYGSCLRRRGHCDWQIIPITGGINQIACYVRTQNNLYRLIIHHVWCSSFVSTLSIILFQI